MKTITSWILESVIATAVIVLCLGIPSVLNLPLWTLALSGIPMLLYLTWRLDRNRFSWQFTVLMAMLLGGLMLVNAYALPEAWHSWSPYIMILILTLIGSRLRRKLKETHHAV